MQRTVSRSPFFAVDFTRSIFRSHRPFILRLLVAVAVVAVRYGLAGATEPDNVLLDFTATWCGPCQQMSSIVSKLERQGYAIRKVDVDKEPGLAAKFGVESIPTFILVANGQEQKRATGITSEQQLVSMLKMLAKRPSVRTVADTRQDGEVGPRLGAAVPITPPNETKPPRRTLPLDPTPTGETQGPPPSLPDHEFRLQSPEVNPPSSSVRIRVKDGTALNFGSGTIIDSKPGRATILTCGHIFRKLSKNAVIEIDLYHGPKGSKPDTVPGRVLLTDLEADLGLVTINFPLALPTMPLGLSQPLAVSEKLFSIGCSGGNNPSRENLELTAINKYRGPENLECTGRPQKGRSGGGLFRDEELVGVCIAADPDKPLGLYTGMQPISVLLEKAGLAHLLPRLPRTEPANIARTREQPAETSLEPAQTPFRVADATGDADLLRLMMEQSGDAGAVAPSGVPQDFAGAEVICIVRSKVPGKPSRVVIVNQASDRFVADLLHESTGESGRSQPEIKTADRTGARNSQGPVETSLELAPYRRAAEKCDPQSGTCPTPESRPARTNPSKLLK